MSCNNNTAPLPNTETGTSCNNGCVPKDINIICRNIIIPNGQNILGVQNDINSISRTFILPIETEDGISLEDKNFSIVCENSNKYQWKENIPTSNIEVLENYIKLKWELTENDTAVAGNLKTSIEATSENFKWQTYSVVFIINPSLFEMDNTFNPPLNLQSKEIISTAENQIVKADIGFDGLSQVEIKGDINLIPENIKKGITIFGITGIYE